MTFCEKMLIVQIVTVMCAAIDIRTLRVPNYITIPFWIAGCADSWNATFISTLLFLSIAMFYFTGALGAADIKLCTGIAAWIGWHAFPVFFLSVLFSVFYYGYVRRAAYASVHVHDRVVPFCPWIAFATSAYWGIIIVLQHGQLPR